VLPQGERFDEDHHSDSRTTKLNTQIWIMAYQPLGDKYTIAQSMDGSDDELGPPKLDSIAHRRLNRIWRLTIVNVILVVLQLCLLAFLILPLSTDHKEKHIQGTYGFDTKYMTISHDFDWLWEDRAVQRAGAIALETDEKTGEVVEYGIISMYDLWSQTTRQAVNLTVSQHRFHQLHCVASLRKALQSAHEGGHVAFDQNEDPHWPHCLHYLHQVRLRAC